MAKKKKEKSNKLTIVYIIVTVLYTLVFCYCAYLLLIMPDSLGIMNFVLLGVLFIPYLMRLLNKNLMLSAIVLEIIIILIAGYFYVSWPAIKSNIDNDCGFEVKK